MGWRLGVEQSVLKSNLEEWGVQMLHCWPGSSINGKSHVFLRRKQVEIAGEGKGQCWVAGGRIRLLVPQLALPKALPATGSTSETKQSFWRRGMVLESERVMEPWF